MTENNETQPTLFEHFKNIFTLLFKKQYKDSFNELLIFAKKLGVLLKELYIKHLKGQYVEIKGKRVPRTAIAILCVVLLYLISPMSCLFSGESQPEKSARKEAAEIVTYNQDGLKISMQKCANKQICGDLKYNGDEDIEKLRINIRPFSKKAEELTSVTFDLTEENLGAPLVQNSHFDNIEFPIDQNFGFFKIDVQINPEDEEEYEEENDED